MPSSKQGKKTRIDIIKSRQAKPLSIDEFAGSLGPPPEGKSLSDYLHQVDCAPMVRTTIQQLSGTASKYR